MILYSQKSIFTLL